MGFGLTASHDARNAFERKKDGVTRFGHPFKRRGHRLALLAVVFCMTAPVWAADDVAMTSAQIQAIGIRLVKLDAPTPAAGVAYSARVVLPRSKEQIVSAAVSGMVDQVLVEDHAIVRAGQPLLRLNSPEFGELQLKLLETTNQSRVAGSTLAREKSLVAEGIVPERRALEAQATASNARAAQQQASAAVRLAGADEATVARIAAGKVQDRLELRAPRAGTILSIEVKPGQRVADADPLLRMAELGSLWLDIDMPADQADTWDRTATLQVVGRDVTAKPLSVSAQVNGSQTATLRAEVVSGVDALRPGEFVQVQVPLRAGGDAWHLPNAAVVHQDTRTVVFVRVPAGFVARDVHVVSESAQGVSVTGPFKTGDEVAVVGTIALKAAWLGESGAEEE
jgi:RND family efflux transporter MFP subunit